MRRSGQTTFPLLPYRREGKQTNTAFFYFQVLLHAAAFTRIFLCLSHKNIDNSFTLHLQNEIK